MKKKESKGRFLIICSALLFTIILFADFYAAVNYPDNFAFIITFMIIDVACLFGTIYGILIVKEEKEMHREEQYDSIFKSEKASYLMLRKYFEEITEGLERIENQDHHVDFPTDDIVNAQKAAAKIIISRNKENADAILMATENLLEEFDAVKEYISNETGKTADNQKRTADDQMKEMMLALKDMEMRINAAIQQCQNAVSQIPNQIQIPAQMPVSIMPQMAAPVMQAPVMPAPQPAPEVTPTPVQETIVSAEEAAPVEDIAIEDVLSAIEDIAVDDIAVEDTPILEEELAVEDTPILEEEIVAEEPVAEEAVLEEPIIEEPVIEEAVEEAPAADLPPMPDLSDPNAKMDPDDIAALIANMAANPEVVPAEEPAEEPIIEEVVEEAPAADLPPMPDLSDPNAKMDPDDIAALIANMNAGVEPEAAPEPEPEEIPPMPDLSDPNKVMSPEEIAALIANI